MKKIALIPLRGGSKGIANKNLKVFINQSLCDFVINSALSCDDIDEVWISTEAPEIKSHLRNRFKEVNVFDRDPIYASDTATTESVISEFLSSFQSTESVTVVLLQATSPFTSKEMISEALQKFVSKKYDSLLSVVPFKRFLWNAKGIPLNYDPQKRPRRQDFEPSFMENGAIYIFQSKQFMQEGNRIFGNVGLYEMPEYTAIEIDELSDWTIAENIYKSYK